MERGGQDFLSKLADRGEEAISRLADAPGGSRFADAAKAMRDRMDELQKRLRGLDALEKRVAELEKRVNDLQGKKPPAAKAPAPAKKPAAKPKPKAPGSSTGGSRASGGASSK
jgi:chemotaxis response regulator CheB